MKKLDRFLLRDILSDGPAGTVYRAEEILPGDNRRTVALKVLPSVGEGVTGESPAEQRFFGEVRVLSQLAVHPHIATIYAMGITEGYPWLAMEHAAGTLAQRMGDTPVPGVEVHATLEQVARGLAAMHALKPPLIHQDLKPANILVDALGNLKITDFSLATVTAAHKTHGMATVRYAAPEMLSSEFGKVGPHTDLYALGHIAYELALGARLLRAQFPAVFEGHGGKEPPPNKWMMWHASINMRPNAVADVVREFPATLSEVIARLMAKPLAERYASAEELLSDLALLRQEAGSVPAPERTPRATATPAASPRAPAAPAAPRTSTPPPPLPVEAAPVVSLGGGAYWVRLRGKVTGPFDLATLQRQVKQGQISRMHQISTDQVTWKQASDIEGLYGTAIV